MRRPLTKWICLPGLVPLALALSGCQNLDANSASTANVRFVGAASAAPGIDFYFGNSPMAYNVGFGTVTSYAAVNPGGFSVNAEQANSRSVLAAASANLAAARDYTVIVSSSATGLQETVLADQSSPPPSGQIALRLLDQAGRAGAVDVYLVPSSATLPKTSPLVTGLTFGANSGYLNLPAGTYAITVVPAGTVPVTTTATLLSGASVAYAAGAVRTVVLLDTAASAPPGVQAAIASDYDSPGAGGPL